MYLQWLSPAHHVPCRQSLPVVLVKQKLHLKAALAAMLFACYNMWNSFI